MGYNGKWIDSFDAEVIDVSEFPRLEGKIRLITPDIDYIFDREQWSEFKEKINKI